MPCSQTSWMQGSSLRLKSGQAVYGTGMGCFLRHVSSMRYHFFSYNERLKVAINQHAALLQSSSASLVHCACLQGKTQGKWIGSSLGLNTHLACYVWKSQSVYVNASLWRFVASFYYMQPLLVLPWTQLDFSCSRNRKCGFLWFYRTMARPWVLLATEL